jgi:glycosyltransferase involved in cell wall biosynthesis
MQEKILVTATTFPRWEKDKEATFVKDLSISLAKRGFDVHVLVPHCSNLKLRERLGLLEMHRFTYFYPRSFEKLAYGGMLPNLKKNPLLIVEAPFLFLSELKNIFKIVKQEKINLIHSHWLLPQGLTGAIARKQLDIKHLLTIHAAGLFILERLPFKREIADFIATYSDAITIVSGFGRERFLSLLSPSVRKNTEKKIELISMGTDVSMFREEVNKKSLKKKYNVTSKNTLLFIGRLAEKKGLAYLIRAMPRIIKKEKNTLLLVLGDGPLRQQLEALTKKLNIQNNVRFVGYISGKDKVDYFRLADILVVPSIVTKSGDTEGLPVTIIEGMASGLAIVATNVGGAPDIIKNNKNAFMIEQKSPKQIAEKVLTLLQNPRKMRFLSREALKTGNNYDWSVIGKRYADVIERILKN